MPQDILTPRLALIAITPASLTAEQASSHSQLAAVVSAQIPSQWPPEHWDPHVLTLLQTRFQQDPSEMAWNRYIALRDHPNHRTLIGTLGGFRHPDRPAECEIGYSVLPQFQRQGYATEGMHAFLAWAWQHPFLQRVAAQTFPTLPASIRVMEKCGLTFHGPGYEPGTILYRRDRPPKPDPQPVPQ